MDRQDRRKRRLLESLAQMPIVEYACRRAGIGRSTYYRWLKEDSVFAEQAAELLAQGIDLVNDLAESKVVEGIKAGDKQMIMYWLNNRHPVYRNYRLERALQETETEQLRLRNEHEKFTLLLKSFMDSDDDGSLLEGSVDSDQAPS